ncbi:MAG: hypothetical protein ACI35W_05145 [Anaeroplasmataceae bacterium]
MRKKLILIFSTLFIVAMSIVTGVLVASRDTKDHMEVFVSNVYKTSEISFGSIKCEVTFPKGYFPGIDDSNCSFIPSDDSFIENVARKNEYYIGNYTDGKYTIEVFKKGEDYYKLTYETNPTEKSFYVLQPYLETFSRGEALFPGKAQAFDTSKTSWEIDFTTTLNITSITELYAFYNEESSYYFKKDDKIYLNLYNVMNHEELTDYYLVINPNGTFTYESR